MSEAARDALRRYLEQRRELGERELVLDGMSVDDVLGVLGARARVVDDVEAPADHPRLIEDAASARRIAPPDVPPERDVAPDAESPAGAESGDWRAALRAAGAEGPASSPRPPAPATPAAPPPQVEAPPEPPRAPEVDVQPSSPPAPAPAAPIGDFGAPIGLDVGGPGGLFGGPLGSVVTLDEIARIVAGCTACPLYRGAKNAVPGEGNPDADFVVVGEAPGADEDASGRPFVGASGQLLTKILAAINLKREEVFICNVVKHRPPGNRNPEADEVAACSPYLVRQLELLRPKVILTLGNFAAQTLLGTKLGVSKLRGQVHRYHGIPLVATYHPAALLRNPTWKRPTWEDVQLARRILDRSE